MSALRWTLVALLVASTALFAVSVSIERSEADTHVEPAVAQGDAAEPEGAHEEEGEAQSEPVTGEAESGERVVGVDLESTPLIVLAVLAGLGLAALAASRFGRLLAIAAIALGWAIPDVREVVHQLDESRDGVALIAMIVAVLHLAAAAVSGQLTRTTGRRRRETVDRVARPARGRRTLASARRQRPCHRRCRRSAGSRRVRGAARRGSGTRPALTAAHASGPCGQRWRPASLASGSFTVIVRERR